MFNKTLNFVKSLATLLSILFLSVVALYVLITRVSLHFLPQYQDQLISYLNEATDQRIDIEAISADWEGFDPVIYIENLTVNTSESFSIKRISFYFSFLHSLIALQPRFDRIIIDNTNLTLKQTEEGDWEFLNFSTNSNELGNNQNNSFIEDLEFLAFFNDSTINVKNLSAQINNNKGKLRTLRLPGLNINYHQDELFASGQILQKLGDKTLLNFSLQADGFLRNGKLKGIVFVEARSSEFFSELLTVYDWEKIRIQDIEGSSRAWIRFDGAEIQSVLGDLQVSQLNWQVAEKSLPPIHNLALSYLWEKKSDTQELSIDNFAFEWAGNSCQPVDSRIVISQEKIDVAVNQINIECVNKIALAVDLLPQNLNQRLSISEPTGYLKNIHIMLPRHSNSGSDIQREKIVSEEEAEQVSNMVALENIEPSELEQSTASKETSFSFEARLDNVNIKAYESTPSGSNLSGYIFADSSGGYVSFQSNQFELGFPTLFLEPWLLSKAEGHVYWELSQDEVVVASKGLRLWREDGSLIYGDFKLDINDETKEDYLTLSIGMKDIAFVDAVKFVPYFVVSHDLYQWLSDSLVGGKVTSGVYYGEGSVESNSKNKSFSTTLFLDTENGRLKFDKEWPALENLNASISLENNNLSIHSETASLASTKLEGIKALLNDSGPNKTNYLKVSATSLLSEKLVDYWLRRSPIASNLKTVSEQLEIKSKASVDIALQIPVSGNAEPSEFLVNTNVIDGEVFHKSSDLRFKNVSGMITVSSKNRINATNLSASLFNEPALIGIKTSKSQKGVELTSISLKTKLGANDIFDYFGAATPSSVLNGKFNVNADLSISSDETKYPMLVVRSDLQGLTCQCPSPFSKNSTDKDNLYLSLLIKPDQYYLEGSLTSKRAPDVKAELLFVNDKPTFGEIVIGGAKIKDTNVKGLNIAANIKLANLENWLDFIDKVSNEGVGKQRILAENRALKQVKLNIDDLDAFGYLLNKTSILIKPVEYDWLIETKGKSAKGIIRILDQKPIEMDFEHLHLISLDNILNKNSPVATNTDTIQDPRELPRLSFHAKNVVYEDRELGSWQFDLQPDKEGAVFRNLKGYLKGTNIAGQINWRYKNLKSSSIAILNIAGSDIEPVFTAFDLPVLMTSTKYSSEISLHWPDTPMEFSLAALSGNVSLDLEDGFLKTEDQKTGILRVFGILNAESIKRRLKLDFSDLYKSGVGFDTFSTKASIDQGNLTITEPLIIDGPAGKYVLNGKTNLGTEELDIDMLVELPFSQNVPLAALVLGAPQIGGLVWVADKLLGEPLSALTTSRYDITGNWEKPVVNLKQALNASKKDRTNEGNK